jgi:hypothetical protein
VNSGTAGHFAYYPSAGNTVGPTNSLAIDGVGNLTLGADLYMGNNTIRSGGLGNIKVDDDISFPDGTGPVGGGELLIRNNPSNLTNLTLTTTSVSVKGPFKFQSYTTTERNALTPANGWVIYNTTTNQLQVYANGAWAILN